MQEVEFDVSHLFEGISDTNTALLRIATGSNPAKVLIEVESTGQNLITVDKGTTYNDDGTELTIHKRNETDDHSATFTGYYTPTVDSSGDEKKEGFISGGGQGVNRIGGKASVDGNLTWEANSDHLIKMKNTSGGEADIFCKVMISEIR